MKDITIKIEGLPQNQSSLVINSLKEIVNQYSFLDFRRLDKIIITTFFEKEISLIKSNNRDKNVNKSTKAVVLTLPKNNDFELLLIIRADFIIDIIKSKQSKDYKRALHIIHHELAHIHDNNKKIDMFKDEMNNSTYKGLDSIFYSVAELCWSEYIANFLSTKSVIGTDYVLLSAKSLLFCIKEIETINNRFSFKEENKNESLIIELIKQIDTFFKRASYLIGYLNGLGLTLDQLDEKISLDIHKSFTYKYFNMLRYELNTMHSLYPYGFVKITIYEKISNLVKNFYEELGIFIFEENNRLQIFIK